LLQRDFMLSADRILWLLTTAAQAIVVYLFLTRGLFRKFLFLNLFLSLSAAFSLIGCLIYARSIDMSYVDFYYFTQLLLTVVLLLSVYEVIVYLAGATMRRAMAYRVVAVLLAATWLPSLAAPPLPSRVFFAASLSQILYLLGGLALAALCAWMLFKSPHDPLAARLGIVFAAYFSLFLLTYGAHQWTPRVIHILFPVANACLPIGCGFVVLSHHGPPCARS
jgi:hypothetical protein